MKHAIRNQWGQFRKPLIVCEAAKFEPTPMNPPIPVAVVAVKKGWSEPFKFWVWGNLICLPIVELVIQVAFYHADKNHGGDILPIFRWFVLGLVVFLTTFLAAMMALTDSTRLKEKIKSGEIAPFLELKYENGSLIGYGNTIKITHGSQVVRMKAAEFLRVAKQVEENYLAGSEI